MAQRLDPPVRAFRQARSVAGQHAARGGDRVDGIGFAVLAAHAAFRPEHLVHGETGGLEPPGQRRAERVRALHADPGAAGRVAEHGDQMPVPVRVGSEGVRGKDPAVHVEQGEGVDAGVRVHPGDDRGRLLHRRLPVVAVDFPGRSAPRIQFVSATPVFGWLVFDITLPSSRYQTSLGVSQSRTFMGVSLISWTMACRSSSVRSSKLVLLGR